MLTFEDTDALSAPTQASTRARNNFANNQKALAARQPGMNVAPLQNIAEFLLGRDGSLTARDMSGNWISRSSLPNRVAREILKKLELNGTVGCLLCPTHAAQIRVALDRIGPQRAIVAIVPSIAELTQLLHCDDFSEEITANRLWFASGENWVNALRQIFADHTGLPCPTQFIKLPLVAAEMNDVLISGAQTVFSEIQKTRANAAKSFPWQRANRTAQRTVAIIAPTHFRLWNDHGHALAQVLGAEASDDLRIIHIDPDDPISADPLDLPRRLIDCDAVISAEMSRVDLPNLLSVDLPWISWRTSPRIPPIESAGLYDHLIVADPQTAFAVGWPSHRVHRAAWPTIVGVNAQQSPQALAIIADTLSLDTPADLNDFSSHRVLWDTLKVEILNNPFVVGSDPNQYLLNRLKQVGFSAEQFPVVRFLTQLIYPAIAQSIAAILLAAKLPLKLYGRGWDQIESLARAFAGTVSSRSDFESIIRQPVALVDVWPGIATHPVRMVGRSVLPFAANARESFIRSANRLLSPPATSPASAPAPAVPTLSLHLIRQILSTIPA